MAVSDIGGFPISCNAAGQPATGIKDRVNEALRGSQGDLNPLMPHQRR
jgi:hypothetical protein